LGWQVYRNFGEEWYYKAISRCNKVKLIRYARLSSDAISRLMK